MAAHREPVTSAFSLSDGAETEVLRRENRAMSGGLESVDRLTDGPAILVLDRPSQTQSLQGLVGADGLRRMNRAAAKHGVAVVIIETTTEANDRRLDRRPLVSDLPDAELWIEQAAAIVLVYDDAELDIKSPDLGTVELNVDMSPDLLTQDTRSPCHGIGRLRCVR